MHIGVFLAAALSAACVWFWPELRVILAEQEWSREMVAAIDDATGKLPEVPGLRGPSHVARPEITGRVVTVTDGDTFTVAAGKQRVRVRLAEIDAPERGQPWGQRAKKALSAMINAKAVRIVAMGLDRQGRTLGRVYVKDVDVNAEMVRRGSAHVYRAHLTDTSLIAAEDEARVARRGLWSLSVAETSRPWEWRNDDKPQQPLLNCIPAGEARATLREALINDDAEMGARVVAHLSSDMISATPAHWVKPLR
jgi:micrococcal nuclease